MYICVVLTFISHTFYYFTYDDDVADDLRSSNHSDTEAWSNLIFSKLIMNKGKLKVE